MFFARVLGRFGKYWLPLVLWMALIFSASTSLGASSNTSRFVRPFLLWLNPHMTEQTIVEVHLFIRKTAHFVEYAGLGCLACRAVHNDPAFRSFSVVRQFWFAILISAFYASTDEVHQSFVPGRQPAVHDVLLDTFGASVGLVMIWSVRRLRHAK
jgi:VanZ family protein